MRPRVLGTRESPGTLQKGPIHSMHVLEAALHPLLVHVLLGLGFLYPLSRQSERVSEWIRVPVRVQARVLLVLFPVVIAAGFLARSALLPIGARMEDHVDMHLALGLLTYLFWFSLIWSDARRTCPVPSRRKSKTDSFILGLGFLALLATATLGGQLVYGRHPIISPAFFRADETPLDKKHGSGLFPVPKSRLEKILERNGVHLNDHPFGQVVEQGFHRRPGRIRRVIEHDGAFDKFQKPVQRDRFGRLAQSVPPLSPPGALDHIAFDQGRQNLLEKRIGHPGTLGNLGTGQPHFPRDGKFDEGSDGIFDALRKTAGHEMSFPGKARRVTI